ncbi:acyltransferase family protein [Pseudolysinimonas yzui]|uniref:Acyltransferase n=1 Tax=Pseudolysinimonas yzui TaxID=2708254 RepID=A0A8J3M0S1_9MICO|nr:acyltransferase family protein [Pseudolysinimonas yzui]GHF15484.1 acyltransferase [Pseudolysinimonas yzui]
MTTTVPQRTEQGTLHREPLLLEVQALRALAVMLVVVYHVWPGRLTGGFVGVDVFFVISGYLITAHLLREYAAEGRIRVAAFWSRRIRRLLPAAFLVLAVCAIAAFFVLPDVVRSDALRQIAAASLYGLNWVLAIDAVDYLAAGDTATVVQHYWTLSVEEQFYVLWPLVLVVAAFVAARFSRSRKVGHPARLVAVVAAVVVVVSLAYSIVFTWLNPAFAYFSTFTRAWEFAAGGSLAASALVAPALWERVRASVAGVRTGLLTVIGAVLVVGAAFLLDGASPFPGAFAAFPVVGTMLLILGGMPEPRILGAPVRWRPVQFLGDISYSLYLWHWPLIMGFVLIAGRRPAIIEAVAIVIASIVLAALTKVLVEDPARRSQLLSRRLVAAFALAAIGGAAFVGTYLVDREVTAAQRVADRQQLIENAANTSGCFGANALLGDTACPDPFVLGADTDLTAAAYDLDYQNWCLTWFDQEWASCEFGDLAATNGTLALVGDSHAASMVAAFDEYFATAGWKVVTYTRFGCSGLNQGLAGADDVTEQGRKEYACRVWSERVRAELVARDDITDIVYLNYTSSYLDRAPEYVLTVDDIVATWQEMLAAGKDVHVVKDWPRTDGDSIPVCLTSHVGETGPCSTDRAVSLPEDPQDAALALTPEVQGIDLSDAYCDESRCYAVVGGVVVYADHNHISGSYALSLMPYLGPRLTGD